MSNPLIATTTIPALSLDSAAINYHPYLTFSLQGLLYGISTLFVQEIFYLPELTPVPEAPTDIAGIVNFRGKILPVMNLCRRLGHPHQEYRLHDSVIVVEWEGLAIGLVVDETHEVKLIPAEATEASITYGREGTSASRFVNGVAKIDSQIIMLLNLERLLRDAEPAIAATSNSLIPAVGLLGPTDGPQTNHHLFFPQATPEEKAIFQQRAENLRQLPENQDFKGLMSLAVVGLNGEYFALDLSLVREFTDVRKVTPIPCCPPHIIGNMNLRGEIVTLVDIRHVLSLSKAASDTNAAKVMVVAMDDLVAGVTVDEVLDVIYLHPSDIKPVPAAVASSSDDYLRGTAPYRDKMMSILEFSKVFIKGDLEVYEEA